MEQGFRRAAAKMGRNGVGAASFVRAIAAPATPPAAACVRASQPGQVTMLGQKRDPIADLLICRKAGRAERIDPRGMTNPSPDAAAAVACPACTRTMTHVRTIWRAFQDDLQVFECRACSVSVSVKVPPKSQ